MGVGIGRKPGLTFGVIEINKTRDRFLFLNSCLRKICDFWRERKRERKRGEEGCVVYEKTYIETVRGVTLYDCYPKVLFIVASFVARGWKNKRSVVHHPFNSLSEVKIRRR